MTIHAVRSRMKFFSLLRQSMMGAYESDDGLGITPVSALSTQRHGATNVAAHRVFVANAYSPRNR